MTSTEHPALRASRLRRRTVLKWMSASGAVLALPWTPGCSDGSDHAGATDLASPPHFLGAGQRAILDALADTLLPEDATVGAVRAGAVEYIDRYLAAFTHAVPDIFRGGPFSGREPFPDAATGAASDNFPENSFVQVLPLSRMQELAFRREFFGSDAIANGAINAPIVERWPGLHALYEDALAQLASAAVTLGAGDFTALSAAQQLAAYGATDPRFRAVFVEHLAQGMFSAPEYGGNSGLVAWGDYHYDGDSQPLGHTLFDPVAGVLYDRVDSPNQTIDDDAFADPMSDAVLQFVGAITRGQGGKQFF